MPNFRFFVYLLEHKYNDIAKTLISFLSLSLPLSLSIYIYIYWDARGVMVTAVENGHGDPSSNPGRSCLHFPLC